jgi:hypothetical protein
MKFSAPELTQTDLFAKIDAAFGSNLRPAVWPHDEAMAISGADGAPVVVSDETSQAARAFAGLDWTRLDATRYEQLSRGYAEPFLAFHSNEAFKYYLPAYMKMLVESERARENLLGPLVHALTPNVDARDASLRAWKEARLAQFSKQQAGAILDFLEFIGRKYGVVLGKVDPGGSWDDFAAPMSYWATKARHNDSGE